MGGFFLWDKMVKLVGGGFSYQRGLPPLVLMKFIHICVSTRLWVGFDLYAIHFQKSIFLYQYGPKYMCTKYMCFENKLLLQSCKTCFWKSLIKKYIVFKHLRIFV